MVRKQIFNIANKVYTGQDIIPGIGPKIIISTNDAAHHNAFNGAIDTTNLYFNLTRTFGPCKMIGPLQIRMITVQHDAVSDEIGVSEAENSQR